MLFARIWIPARTPGFPGSEGSAQLENVDLDASLRGVYLLDQNGKFAGSPARRSRRVFLPTFLFSTRRGRGLHGRGKTAGAPAPYCI
jgi:hypothetical protein